MGVGLNVDIPGSISELKEAMKDFSLRLRLYRILLRGKSLEFEGYRSYEPDDDAQTIDWKTSNRANKLMVKQYREEQDMKILFVVDVGEHMVAGSTEKLKCEYAAETISALSHLILESGDKIGLVLYNNKIKEVIMPKRGIKHFQYIVDLLSDSSNYGGGSRIDVMLDFLIDYVSPSIKGVVIISDFIACPNSIERKLGIVGSKFETLAIMVKDPLDFELPDINGELMIENPITGQQMLINPKLARTSYSNYANKEQKRLEELFKKSNIDLLYLKTNNKFVPVLSEFLKSRVKKRNIL